MRQNSPYTTEITVAFLPRKISEGPHEMFRVFME